MLLGARVDGAQIGLFEVFGGGGGRGRRRARASETSSTQPQRRRRRLAATSSTIPIPVESSDARARAMQDLLGDGKNKKVSADISIDMEHDVYEDTRARLLRRDDESSNIIHIVEEDNDKRQLQSDPGRDLALDFEVRLRDADPTRMTGSLRVPRAA